MKKIIHLAFIILTTTLYSQINVSSLTSSIKGSGGLSLDNQGNLYIGDFGDFLSAGDNDGLPNNVWKLDTNLNLTVYSGGFIGASGNDFDSNGILYQSDIGANAIYKIVNGIRTFVTSIGISAPVGIVFDSNDNFYVCNCGNNTIRKITSSGVSTQFASGSIFFCPNGITIDEDDNLYVSNFSNGNIIKITTTGVATVLNTTPGGSTSAASNGHLDYFQATRKLFIASHGSNQIYKMSIDNPSDLEVIAGSGVRGNSDSNDALTATFSRPNGVVITQTGDSIYVNSAVPLTNIPNNPLNPQVIRLLKGVNGGVLSVESVTPPSFNLITYPNPVIDNFTIQVELTNIDVKIYDVQGTEVKSFKDYRAASYDIKNLASGVYFVKIKGLEGESIKKIIKQ